MAITSETLSGFCCKWVLSSLMGHKYLSLRFSSVLSLIFISFLGLSLLLASLKNGYVGLSCLMLVCLVFVIYLFILMYRTCIWELLKKVLLFAFVSKCARNVLALLHSFILKKLTF